MGWYVKDKCKVCGEDIRWEEPEDRYPEDGDIWGNYRRRKAEDRICVPCLCEKDEKCTADLLTSLLDSMSEESRGLFVRFLKIQESRPDLIVKTLNDYHGIEGIDTWGLW